MTNANEVGLLETDEFLPAKMREAKINADRKQCQVVLIGLLVARQIPVWKWKATVKTLSALIKCNEPECQTILDELVDVNLALKCGECYFPTDEFVAAWKSRLGEIDFEF